MESTYATEESNSKDPSATASTSPTEISENSADLPTLPATREAHDNYDHKEPRGHEGKSAQAEVQNSNLHTTSADSLDSSLYVAEMPLHNLTERHVESNAPSDTAPEILSNSRPNEVCPNLTNGIINRPSSADATAVNKMSRKLKKTENSETKPESPYKALVDTAAPFESVREAVTKFGGIVDWKAHKAQMIERRKLIQFELEKLQTEIPRCKEELGAAEITKSQVVDELERTKRLIEELKHHLEKAQTEEAQAEQDSELAQLRAQEMEHGIADETSAIARTQMKVAKERHAKAVSELRLVKEELRSLHEQYEILIEERDAATKRAEEVISAGMEIEKRVEELTLELIASKGSLELAHAAHHEAEERRIGAAAVKEKDCLTWEKKLHQAQEELQQLNSKILSKNDMKMNIDANLQKLLSLNSELAAYMENKLSEEAGVSKEHGYEDAKQISNSIQDALAFKRKELQEVKGNIEKAKTEANLLRFAAATLGSELGNEKAALDTLQQREAMTAVAISSLESELNRTKQEVESVKSKEADAQEKMVELPKVLQQATQEAEDIKVAAHLAQEELTKAKGELEQTKSAATTTEVRLCAVIKEIEASKASERLALAAVQALQESKEARDVEDSPRRVTLPLSEYYELSKKAHEAEELANEKVAEALALVVSAKESEARILERLNETSEEMDEKKEALEIGLERSERANEGKLAAEQGLRKWRADHEQLRRAYEAAKRAVNNPLSGPSRVFVEQKGFYPNEQESKLQMSGNAHESLAPSRKLQRKKSLFPLMGSVLSKKTRAQT